MCATRREAIGQGCKGPAAGLSQQAGEAGGSPTLGVQGRVGAAPTTPGRVGTARRPGPGKQDGKVDVRNQRCKAPQGKNRLQPGGYGPGGGARPRPRATLMPVVNAGQEATGKACGVPVARPLGHSWPPPPSTDRSTNVGTAQVLPSPPAGQAGGGQVRCRLLAPGWGGAAVVVRGRESRPHAPAVVGHGEGRQRVRSARTGRPGGRR
jgi:hypothetical protein